VSKVELCNYLFERVSETTDLASKEEMKERFEIIVDVLFEQMDVSNNGFVDLDNFVSFYHNEQKRLYEEIEELEFRIKDENTKAGQLSDKLNELRKQEKYTQVKHFKFSDYLIMQGSILSVYVIDARDLLPSSGYGTATPQVRLQIEG
jgi:transcription initiation factor TFIID subunit TAF12